MSRQKLVLAIVLGAVLGLAGCNREQSDWEKARADNSSNAYEAFLKKYPNGAFTAQAQARLKEQNEERDWQKARDVDTSEAYQAFLLQYPEGKWSQEARIRVENFALAQATPGGPAPVEETLGTPATPAGAAASGAAPSGPSQAGATAPGAPPASVSQPMSKPAAPGSKAVVTAPAKPAPSATPGARASADAKLSASHGRGGEVVQLGAFKSGKAAADRRWTQLKGNYPQVFKGLEPVVRSAKTGQGAVYRLQVSGLTPARARALCKKLVAHAEACVVLPKTHRK